MRRLLKTFDAALEKFAFGALLASLFFMLSLTLLNIAARWFGTTFVWIDPLARHLVFLTAFMGAVLAAGKSGHIKIDIAGRALEALGKRKARAGLSIFVSSVCVVACALLCKAGWTFAAMELEYGKKVFLGVHSGFLAGIIPFGFALLGARFLVRVLLREGEG